MDKPPSYQDATQNVQSLKYPTAPPVQIHNQQYPPAMGERTTILIQQQQPVNAQRPIIIMNACPVCRVGSIEERFSLCGILIAILFFPMGILCCLIMRDKYCTNCGASF